jgi:hypothetical protein
VACAHKDHVDPDRQLHIAGLVAAERRPPCN